MSNQDFVPPFDTTQNTVTGLPPRRENKSIVWDSFTIVSDSGKAQCNFCNALLKCNNGTTSMMAHARRCKGNPNVPNRRMKSTTSSAVTSPSLAKFDQEKCQLLLPTQFLGEGNDPDYYLQKYLITTGTSSSAASSSDLSKYLNEALECPNPDFCILNWWRVNSNRLSILASIARDVLVIPISTVASESAFSTGGRVVDEYRSSLTAQSVEALICTEDWLNGGRVTLFPSQEDIEEIEKFE